jgi:Family of unknown function (DUF6585)
VQGGVDMADESVASVADLPWIQKAKPISTHPRSWAAAASFMSAGIILAAVGVFFAILVLVTPNFAPPPGNYIAAAVCLLGGAGILAWQIVRYRPRLDAVTVFPEGVAWSDGDGWHGVPWDKLKRLYRSEVKVNSMWKTRELRLEWGDDESVVIAATVHDWPRLANLVQELQTDARWPRAAESFNAGKWVKCGPISVSRTGVRTEQTELRWDEIKKVHLFSGALWLEAVDGLTGCTLAFGAIANFDIFQRLLQIGLKEGDRD